jgi:hypothetical protein
MSFSRRGTAIWIICIFLTTAGIACAGTQAIGPSDWQYHDLDALSRAGLLNGHPSGPIGEWAGEQLSRFEAASLTLRAVEGLGKAYQEQGRALEQIAQAPTGETATAAPPPAGVTIEDVARVEKLIEEFRAELVTMGARVDDLSAAVKDVQTRLVKVEADQKQHKLDGYMQVRYVDDGATTGKNEFLVRRARLNIRGPVSDRVSYRVELQMDAKEEGQGPNSKTQVRTANIDYTLGPGSLLRVGQAKIPWGYELLESVPSLWTGERSFFMDRLFPNQRDVGVQWSCKRTPAAPEFDLGIFNGTGINADDNNDRKNVMARVNLPIRSGEVALSGYTGENGEGATATRQDRTGLSARYRWSETQFLGEFVAGNDKGHKVRGWYGQVGHPIGSGRPSLLFAKYDQYDENRSKADDMFKRWSLGYWYDLDKATRLTLVWELRNADPKFSEYTKWDENAVYAQMQVKF